MHHVRMLADVVDAARMGADRWYVTNGATAVGPVNLDLIARGGFRDGLYAATLVSGEARSGFILP